MVIRSVIDSTYFVPRWAHLSLFVFLAGLFSPLGFRWPRRFRGIRISSRTQHDHEVFGTPLVRFKTEMKSLGPLRGFTSQLFPYTISGRFPHVSVKNNTRMFGGYHLWQVPILEPFSDQYLPPFLARMAENFGTCCMEILISWPGCILVV